MFAGEYLCKVDEKGRFIVPSPIREQIEADGQTAQGNVELEGEWDLVDDEVILRVQFPVIGTQVLEQGKFDEHLDPHDRARVGAPMTPQRFDESKPFSHLRHISIFHLIASGECTVEIAGEAPRVAARKTGRSG